MAAPKIDKDHGFVKFIINNQLDRDKYEQEQKSRKQKGIYQKDSKKSPDERKVYAPPIRSKEARGRGSKLANRNTQEALLTNDNQSGSLIKQDGQGPQSRQLIKDHKLLFEIEYLPKHSNPVYAKVYQNSSPEAIVQEISAKCNLSDALQDALYWRILDEMK